MWPFNNFPQQNPLLKNSFMQLPPNSQAGNPFMNFGLANMHPGIPSMNFGLPGPNSFFNPRPVHPGFSDPTLLPWMPQAKADGLDYNFGDIKMLDKEGVNAGTLSGNASISGNNFRSLDGENWTPNVQPGKSYNLLSTGNLQVNGSFSTRNGETIMSQIGILAGGSQLTLSSDGTLLIDGKEFKKGKNDMGGALRRDGNNYVLKTAEGYEFTLRASAENGVSMRIKANNVAPNAGGLLGSANDGDKLSESKLKSSLKPRDFEVENVLTFEEVKTSPKRSLDVATTLWASRNPKYDKVELKIGSPFSYSADGVKIADWRMNALKVDKPYLLFSDLDLSVSGTFGPSVNGASQSLRTVSVVINGVARTVRLNSMGSLEVVDSAGKIVPVPGLAGNGVTFQATNADGESYDVRITKGSTPGTLSLSITGTNVGANDYRSGGLLGDVIGVDAVSGNTDNGAGLLRDADGGPSAFGARMGSALSQYQLATPFQTESERGAAEVQEALPAGTTPTATTYQNIIGRTWGDPHFVGADGELYDVQGKAGTIYNIVSDQGIQVNALFGAWAAEGTTVMEKIGFAVNGRQLEVAMDKTKQVMTYKLDGVEMTEANKPSWISWDNGVLVVDSEFQGEKWRFRVEYAKDPNGDHLNLTSKALRIDNHVETTGIWGHSVGNNALFTGNFVGPNNENVWRADLYNKGGSGILRNTDGTTLAFDKKEGSAEHTAALANYVETGLFSKSSFFSQYNK